MRSSCTASGQSAADHRHAEQTFGTAAGAAIAVNWFDLFPGDEQPATLEQWIARQRRNLLLLRCASHAKLDALFDAHERQLEKDAHRIEVDVER